MMGRLKPYMLRYKSRLLWGFFFIMAANLSGIVPPIMVKRAIDLMKESFEVDQLLVFAGLLIALTIVSGFFRFLMRRTVIVVSRLIENDLRNDLFSKLQTMDTAYFQRNNTGDIMSRMTNDLNAIRSVLGPGVMYTVNLVTTFIFVSAMMLYISPLLTLIALLPVPFMALVVNRFRLRIHERTLTVQEKFAEISTKAQENLAGIRIVKSYVLEDSEIQHFDRLNREYIDRNMDLAKLQAAFQPSMMLIVGMGSALLLLFGGQLIINEVITLGDFVAFILYMGMLVFPSIAIGWVLGIFIQGAAAHERLNHILDAQPLVRDEKDIRESDISGQIELKDLTFFYPGSRNPALENINLSIPAGQIVAVVGKTGSGKSSLIHILTRAFNPPRESVFIDGKDILDIPLQALRHHTGYIPQDTFLFSDSISSNIAFGLKEIDQEEVEWAAKIAQIHDSIIEFPKGYDTQLGERGINLSGGQKQRLSIARAIIKHPRILLLDDALSAVDTITEEAILNNLRGVMQDKTCLWVSHRIASIKTADMIIVLDQGRIVETGTHEELLELNGHYADLFEKQQLEDVLEHTA